MPTDPLSILPFAYLSREERQHLRDRLTEHHHAAGDVVFQQGDTRDARVYLLCNGSVAIRNTTPDGTVRRVAVVQEGHYFGERTPLFGGPRSTSAHALEPSHTFSLDSASFLALLRGSPVFARAFGNILRDKQGLFNAFDRFLAEVKHGAARGHIVLPRLLHLYRPLAPALHRGVNSDALDAAALSYALKRLPPNVTRCLSWFLVDDLPYIYSTAAETLEALPTDARRRAIWRMLPGKNLVLLRDGLSDLLDLITCLCIYAVEAGKIRRRLADPVVLWDLIGPMDAETVLGRLDFSHAERELLDRLFPENLRQRLHDIAMHHEDASITVYKQLDNYNSDHAEDWTRQVAAAVEDLLGVSVHDLPEQIDVHIISSNTHSVTNLLSPWLQENRHTIDAWGETQRQDIYKAAWVEPLDRTIALTRPYLAAHPHAAKERAERDRHPGVRVIGESAFTGIAVQVFDTSALPSEGMDPSLPQPGRRSVIVNIDYAFGQQAEPILSSLMYLFGSSIRSINVLGKAGGLVGKRGDALVITRFVEQINEEIYQPTTACNVERLRSRLPDREVFEGPALTVMGTVLQNETLLRYYERIWGCVGVEMEGAWYCRRLLEAQDLGLINADADLRFVYYISDLPLDAHGTLSAAMTLTEGIPPLYAATREVLTAIFEATD